MAYYTFDKLDDFFQAMVNDIKGIDFKTNEIETHSGNDTPLHQTAIRCYDMEFEKYQEQLDWECTDEEAHEYAMGTFKSEIYYYLSENVNDADDPYTYLSDMLEHSFYIDTNIVKQNIFQFIGDLPIEWVHANNLIPTQK